MIKGEVVQGLHRPQIFNGGRLFEGFIGLRFSMKRGLFEGIIGLRLSIKGDCSRAP